MSFFEKLKAAFRKIKTKLIVYLVLILVAGFPLVAIFNVSFQNGLLAAQAGEDFWTVFFDQIYKNTSKANVCLKLCFTGEYFKSFLNTFKWYLLICGLFALRGLIKALPKHEFQDIENGSSDWSENGEQYTVLHRKKGIVLAEKNYLPVDKRGNVNVLVIRWFWCW